MEGGRDEEDRVTKESKESEQIKGNNSTTADAEPISSELAQHRLGSGIFDFDLGRIRHTEESSNNLQS